uniref:MADF domain-containing protein n=1 Tax=Amphimedon queenslandica TaxID=400682 RepID=A0A1X7T078_AMPQE
MAEFDESLISCNSKSADFRITWKKENAWEEVSKKLGCPVEVASKRWKVLLERYTKEHKKAKKPTGTGTDEVKVWEFYHLMDFLQDFVKHRSTVTNMPTFNTPNDELRFSPGAKSTQSNDKTTSSSAAASSDNDK